MARINPKTGLAYVTGTKFSEQDKWKVTVKEVADQIRANKDLTAKEKQLAIIKISEAIDGNSRVEGLRLLNTLYQKAWGSKANQQSPLASFVKETILKSKNY